MDSKFGKGRKSLRRIHDDVNLLLGNLVKLKNRHYVYTALVHVECTQIMNLPRYRWHMSLFCEE